jgi:hypothetical protein
VPVFREPREFAADEVAKASAFIASLRPEQRVYVDEWSDVRWRFVVREDCAHATSALGRLTPGCRFRIRPVRLT